MPAKKKSKKAPSRFVVRVFLYGIEPEIWRRFSVPGDVTFEEFHRVIQQAMGWEDAAMHEFRHGKGKRLVDVIGPEEMLKEGVPGEFTHENEITLNEFVGRRALPIRFLYRYDFRVDWIHEVVIEKREEDTTGKPKMIDGERACPPENCGGVFEYKQCMAGELEWLDGSYDPEKFDPKKVRFR
jgi:hypothetical protein